MVINRERAVYHIGFDDTDSSDGMCTTFLAYTLAKLLLKRKQTRFIDYPNLIRLNPNIPWKTRGNGSLVLRVESGLKRDEIFNICKEQLDKFATSARANAGLIVHEGNEIPEQVIRFSKSALFDVERISNAKKIMNDLGMIYYGKRNQQGLVGALAGIGNQLKGDFTFELIAYRNDCRKARDLDRTKIIEMDRMTKPGTFNCYDEENDRVLIMPHGPDPVLFGIRGETPKAVLYAFRMLLPLRNLLGTMIFRSNQGTGEHLLNDIQLPSPKAYVSGRISGTVLVRPKIHQGGHVFFTLRNDVGEIPCAAYEPTGNFRMNVLELQRGDQIEVGGGIRKGTVLHPKILNLEYMIPKKLTTIVTVRNKCPRCSSSLFPDMLEKVLECAECGFRMTPFGKTNGADRKLIENQLYLPDLKAHRHLTKPLQRYSFDNRRKYVNSSPRILSSLGAPNDRIRVEFPLIT